MCFRPKNASTKVLLSELDRDKRSLEQDNALLRKCIAEEDDVDGRTSRAVRPSSSEKQAFLASAAADDGQKLPVAQQLDRELGALAAVHDQALSRLQELLQQLQEATADKVASHADLAGVRRRLELAEASATDQQNVLQLRCAALEQENEQLTGFNQEIQQRLEAALSELSGLKKQCNTDAGVLTKQAADLEASNGRVREAEAEVRTLGTHLAEAVSQAQEAGAKVQELQELASVRAKELEAAGAALMTRDAELEAVRGELRRLQDLASHNQQLYEAATAEESRVALSSTSDRLTRSLEDQAAAEARLAEANAQYLSTKQSVITTAKQLANMAKDHSAALARLHSLEAETTTLREQLASSRSAEVEARSRADASTTTAREARAAAEVADTEARRLRNAYDRASADLRRKIMLLTAIARMANKGALAAAGSGRAREGQDAEQADSYSAVTSEQRLRLKICESPLPLLGALTSGIMDSSRLRHLALDMDTSREVTWEKAGLRICCLAAAVGLNNSLQTLQLGGWTWGELGNGTALPFLALGGGGGVAGGMLRSVQLATNLFDLEAAAMLRDLLAAGLVELAAGGAEEDEACGAQASGQGVLRLYSGNERLDGWYSEMLRLSQRSGQTHAQHLQRPSRSGSESSAHSDIGSNPANTCSSAGSTDTTGALYRPSSARGADGATVGVDCDLSAEALESHHCVLVMTVLLVYPGLRRLRLDGNKLGDGGAALLSLGLSGNTGLRELNLSRNSIRASGARSLARCLEGSNTTLLRLDLSGQRLEGLGAAGAEAMAQALRVNRSLEDLNLSSCSLTGAAAAVFAGAIRAAGASRPLTPPSASGDTSSRPSTASSAYAPPSIGSSSSSSGGGGCLRRLALSSNGIDAATAKVLQAAAAERPGLTLVL
ncbi:hypothetical protein GPECTOR_5g374 [Gonium pectorale]|uniref:Uncharacterized protein n=1 Tax=Gonium pectorale TaxID=33097 RepID=A0A150GWL7_GONPE|nr:hypothetical protein GPECTOR_5g374 [Gonium pectorale]|eukprot:KXZ54287.1 hypothetical protein GPECTOR_5g374 [Gonium pectorale]